MSNSCCPEVDRLPEGSCCLRRGETSSRWNWHGATLDIPPEGAGLVGGELPVVRMNAALRFTPGPGLSLL